MTVDIMMLAKDRENEKLEKDKIGGLFSFFSRASIHAETIAS